MINRVEFIERATWEVVTEKLNDTEFNLTFKAKIVEGWYMYSQYQDNEDGPFPTEFNYEPGESYELVGKTTESENRKKVYDNVFEMDVQKFSKNASFTQKIKINDAGQPIFGYFAYQTCDDKQCIMNEMDFWVNAENLQALIGASASDKIAALTEDGNSEEVAGNIPIVYPAELANLDLKDPAKVCTESVATGDSSIWAIFLLGLLGGFVALLTPCVFPMIPLTVSFFTKSSKDKSKGIRDAALYGAFILAVYLLLSIPFHLMDSINPDILNDISTNVILNVSFFVIFLFFAFSFFWIL